jgi:hypothetical protein
MSSLGDAGAGGRSGSMKAALWLRVALVLLIVAGCAQRSDWIEGMLVTVDVTGRWAGKWTEGGAGEVELTLRQAGPKVKGDFTLTGIQHSHFWTGPIDGSVSGDVLRFSRSLLRGEMIVAGDEMSGTVTYQGIANVTPGAMTLRLQRQPVGVPESR